MPAQLPFPYQRFIESLKAQAEKGSLTWPQLCRETRSAYRSKEDDKSLYQFLFRYGAIPSLRQNERTEKKFREFLGQMNAPDSEEALAALRLFTGSGKGHSDLAICGATPACLDCCLRDQCAYYQKGPPLKELPESEWPRERLIRGGERSLSNAELLAIIIREGKRHYTAIDVAKILLKQHGNLRNLARCSIKELCQAPGIGQAKAAQIKAALTIGLRLAEEEGGLEGTSIHSSQDVFDRYHLSLRDSRKEIFKVILLNRRNRIIRDCDISTGSLSSSIVHPREVLNPAIRDSAAAIICVHNHPSGDPRPSREDEEITSRLAEAGGIVGIELLDHIIIGDGRYYSFADEGRIKPK